MAGIIATGNIPRLLQEGLNKVFGNVYDEHSKEWDKAFDAFNSGKNFEVDAQLEGMGLAPEKPEGDEVSFDSMRQGFTPKYQHLTYAKGFIVTKEALADELYGQLERKARSLAFSMQQTKEVVGANVLNRGFNGAFTMVDGDGSSLFNSAHVLGPSGGTFSNQLAVGADLSEASLEDLLIQISEATDPRGLRIAIKGTRLIVPPKLGFEATRILASVLQNDTANNAVNAIRSMGMLPEGFMVNNYLTSDTAWFIKTNAPNGMKYWTRQEVQFEQDNDFGTSNLRFKAEERYDFGWTDARGSYGTAGV